MLKKLICKESQANMMWSRATSMVDALINVTCTSTGAASLAGISNALLNSRQSSSWVICTPL